MDILTVVLQRSPPSASIQMYSAQTEKKQESPGQFSSCLNPNLRFPATSYPRFKRARSGDSHDKEEDTHLLGSCLLGEGRDTVVKEEAVPH